MEKNKQLEDFIDAVVDENTPDSPGMPDAPTGTIHSSCFEHDRELVSNEVMVDYEAMIDPLLVLVTSRRVRQFLWPEIILKRSGHIVISTIAELFLQRLLPVGKSQIATKAISKL